MADRERIVEVITRAIEWFDFDEPEDTALSLAKVVLANLQAKGFEVVERAAATSYDICAIHLAPRAVSEDPRVCWEYDGQNDCRFASTLEVGGDS